MSKKNKNAAGDLKEGIKTVCQNRKATFNFFIEDKVEAGLVLVGTEVKSLRGGKGSLQEAFAQIKHGEAWVHQFHIPPYEQGNIHNVDPVRSRKLLMHRREIDRLSAKTEQQGYTLVPLRVYFKNGRAKIEVGLAKGKKMHDKRESLKQKDARREMDRSMKVR